MNEVLIVGELSGKAKFELCVICRNEDLTLLWYEAITDAFAVLAAYWDILKVWINA